MHPLKKYLSNIRIASSTPEEYQQQIQALADKVGISTGKLERLHYPTQTRLSPEKGIRLELATNGLVHADTVSEARDIVTLVLKVVEMRENNGGAGNGQT
jgi:hypothetical protein